MKNRQKKLRRSKKYLRFYMPNNTIVDQNIADKGAPNKIYFAISEVLESVFK